MEIGWNWSDSIKIDHKRSKIMKNGRDRSRTVKFDKNRSKTTWIGRKQSLTGTWKLATQITIPSENVRERSKSVKMVKSFENSQNLSKMVTTGQNQSKSVELLTEIYSQPTIWSTVKVLRKSWFCAKRWGLLRLKYPQKIEVKWFLEGVGQC